VVTEVDEQDAAVVADAEDPAREFGGGARVGSPELVASVRTVRVHNLYPRKKTGVTLPKEGGFRN
jgi:hypothetical protein